MQQKIGLTQNKYELNSLKFCRETSEITKAKFPTILCDIERHVPEYTIFLGRHSEWGAFSLQFLHRTWDRTDVPFQAANQKGSQKWSATRFLSPGLAAFQHFSINIACGWDSDWRLELSVYTFALHEAARVCDSGRFDGLFPVWISTSMQVPVRMSVLVNQQRIKSISLVRISYYSRSALACAFVPVPDDSKYVVTSRMLDIHAFETLPQLVEFRVNILWMVIPSQGFAVSCCTEALFRHLSLLQIAQYVYRECHRRRRSYSA